YFQNTSVPSQFTNCIIEGNSAGFVGGGVRFVNAPVSIINSTFTSNSAGIGAEMHLAFAQTNVTVSNSIIRSTAPDSISAAASPVLTINRSSIPPGTTGFTGSNNITADPLFVSSTDFRLAPGSPCIDAGDNTLLPAGLTIDLAGLPRLADDPGAPNTGTTGNGGSAIVDMGAHERSTTPSDTCADAPTLLAGSYPFTTIGTSTDGPDEGSFAPCGDPRLINDVWFRYTATCSGNTSVSLCGSDFDTLLGIYRGSACPTTPGSIVGCNDDSSCGLQSEVTLAVTTGEVLLIRIAGFNGASGSGTVTIACAPTQPTCRIDFNNDGFVEPGDLDDFITAFFSDDEDERNRCDFTSDGIVEPGDLDEFITAFFEGC
ncbi:MAG: choice-of-anchor Q domain-containing protein, partial [Phycisphaerales bacterium]